MMHPWCQNICNFCNAGEDDCSTAVECMAGMHGRSFTPPPREKSQPRFCQQLPQAARQWSPAAGHGAEYMWRKPWQVEWPYAGRGKLGRELREAARPQTWWPAALPAPSACAPSLPPAVHRPATCILPLCDGFNAHRVGSRCHTPEEMAVIERGAILAQ